MSDNIPVPDRRVPIARTRRTPEQQAAHDRQILADFDARFPVGTRVRYFVTLPFGPLRVTTIRSRAWRLGDGEAVASVDGQAGGVSIWHIFESPKCDAFQSLNPET